MSNCGARISDGNSKLGKIPNVSLIPVKTCQGVTGKPPPCAKDCYALKAYRQYPQTREAWGANTKEATLFPERFFASVSGYLAHKSPRFFRWHVAGDILNPKYFERMVAVAVAFPHVRFLAFTKQYAFVNAWRDVHGKLPRNLAVVFSAWPGAPMDNPHGQPVAWVRDDAGVETRIPKRALECPGTCDTCGACWGLKRDVVFNQH